LREHGGYTFKDIGALLGERSHTSVYLMFKKYGPEIAQNPTLASLAQEIGRRLVSVN
jgi:chromosomal replication initiation ATPase DnaA